MWSTTLDGRVPKILLAQYYEKHVLQKHFMIKREIGLCKYKHILFRVNE